MPEIIVFIISIAIVIKGSDWLGRSGVIWAQKFGLPSFVIGATFVAAATSLPELAVATIAGPIYKEPLLALGAVFGAPLINIGVILALIFFFTQKRPSLGYFSRAINIFIVLTFLLFVISLNIPFGSLLSPLLISLGVLFLLLEFVIGNKSHSLFENVENRFQTLVGFFSFTKERETLFEFIFGFVFLILGSSFMVNSALAIASSFKLDELFFSATVVALATSLPELITTINSLIHKREDLAIGTLVGASVIDLSIGVGLASFMTQTQILPPINLIITVPLILCGVFCLLSFWEKVPLRLIALLLTTTFFIYLLIFTVKQII